MKVILASLLLWGMKSLPFFGNARVGVVSEINVPMMVDKNLVFHEILWLMTSRDLNGTRRHLCHVSFDD